MSIHLALSCLSHGTWHMLGSRTVIVSTMTRVSMQDACAHARSHQCDCQHMMIESKSEDQPTIGSTEPI